VGTASAAKALMGFAAEAAPAKTKNENLQQKKTAANAAVFFHQAGITSSSR
jgi:hypothetical protein